MHAVPRFVVIQDVFAAPGTQLACSGMTATVGPPEAGVACSPSSPTIHAITYMPTRLPSLSPTVALTVRRPLARPPHLSSPWLYPPFRVPTPAGTNPQTDAHSVLGADGGEERRGLEGGEVERGRNSGL
jgi:hypothetical protein